MTENVADLTLLHLRRIDQTQTRILEVLERHDARLGRIERDVHEMKSDLIIIENRILSRMNEILDLVRRVDDHEARMRTLEGSIELA